ncbi:MAG: hypothetical protein K0S96_1977, partial [Geminicoccaceae bacterium]|nr:hypothetical protein [Geminicoccaceae bacterium]
MNAAGTFLHGRKAQDRAGREAGEPADEHELVVEVVGQL